MSRKIVIIDFANNQAQFEVKDVSSSVSFSCKDVNGDEIDFSDVVVRAEVLTRGKSPAIMYEDKFSNISKILQDVFKTDASKILPLSVNSDLALSDSVTVQFTLKFPVNSGAKSFSYDLNRIGRTTMNFFKFTKQEISGTEDVDTVDASLIMFLEPEKIENISSEKTSIGFLNYTKDYLEATQVSNSYFLPSEKNQTYTVETNADTVAYLLKY